jgi:hypothetical protein
MPDMGGGGLTIRVHPLKRSSQKPVLCRPNGLEFKPLGSTLLSKIGYGLKKARIRL